MGDARARIQDFVKRTGVGAVAALALAACGGGGGGSPLPGVGGGGNGGGTWTAGVFLPSSTFAAQCANPRGGINPATGRPYPDVRGATVDENNWLRSWTRELYLWYDEVPDSNPASYSTPAYFERLKTAAITASGQPKDRFHYTYPTADWLALSQSGVEAGYGVQWLVLSPAPPRRVVVAYVEPGYAAQAAGLARGDEVLEVDGADLVNGNTQAVVEILNAGLFPDSAGPTHSFTLRRADGVTEYTAQMQSANVTHTPVLEVATLDISGDPVGYILFNDHLATSEAGLIQAIEQLRDANVTDLVLDLRYNGGGYLDIASQLAYMIAGQSRTAGQVFERMTFNDQHPSTNPVTGQALAPLGFHTTTRGFSAPSGQPLPTLDLDRVFVLSGRNTCSASESIINGLRGVDLEVVQIGSSTCGKPYGFYPMDNCGTTYFSIQFRGENAKSFGDYGDGFSPANTAGTVGESVPGCSVADDLTRELGDPQEARLAAALAYRAGGSCPQPTGFAPGAMLKAGQPLSAADGVMYKSPGRENRILREW